MTISTFFKKSDFIVAKNCADAPSSAAAADVAPKQESLSVLHIVKNVFEGDGHCFGLSGVNATSILR
jgi:hypothetical protein